MGRRKHGGIIDTADQIAITSNAGAIYYTTNGADPRIGDVELTSQTLVDTNSAATAFVPTDHSLDSAWQHAGFDDSGWINGNAAVGFDRGSEYAGFIGLDLLDSNIPESMRIDRNDDGVNENNSAYVRVPFHVDDPASIGRLGLDMIYDDGFVAYLNGHEIARANVDSNISWDSAALTNRGGSGQIMIAIAYDSDNRIMIYRNGQIYATADDTSKGTLETFRAGASSALFGLRHQDLAGQTGSADGNDGFFAGSVNEARIYDAGLSARDIQEIFQDGAMQSDNSVPDDERLKHLWTFNTDTKDLIGRAHGSLRGGAELDGGRLILDGIDDYMNTASLNNTISERTLIAWVSVDNLSQQGGGVLTIQRPTGTDVFDSIVFGERVPKQWTAGSNGFARTVANNGGPEETVVGGQVLIPESFDVSANVDKLVAGQNVLAIQIMSHDVSAENMIVVPTLSAISGAGMGINEHAKRFTESFSIDGTSQVRARVLTDAGTWSALFTGCV